MMILQFFLMITVLLLFISGGMKYDMLRLFGIRQIKSGESHSTLSETGAIDTSGVLGLTRHPWYLGAIIFVWIDYREMYVSTFIVSMILTVYLVIGTVLEERKLVIQCGDDYRDYKERVSMLFPFKWISSKLMSLVRTV
jgi:protein-S-isoprenylcysteine O-methyltransferase Ste14